MDAVKAILYSRVQMYFCSLLFYLVTDLGEIDAKKLYLFVGASMKFCLYFLHFLFSFDTVHCRTTTHPGIGRLFVKISSVKDILYFVA